MEGHIKTCIYGQKPSLAWNGERTVSYDLPKGLPRKVNELAWQISQATSLAASEWLRGWG